VSKSQPTAVKIEQWPELDQQLWRDAISKGDFLEPDGAGAHWADTTKTQVQKGYGKWIFHLECEGMLKGLEARRPSQRLNEDVLRSYVKRLEGQGLASQTIASRVTDLTEAIRVMEPKSDLKMLKKLAARMQMRSIPSRKKHARIRPPGEIWQTCLSFMQQLASESSLPSILRASRYRDALALGLLALRPLRRRNMSRLSLGQHLKINDWVWECSIPSQETKDGSPMNFALPTDENFVKCFHRYLQTERQILLKERQLDLEEIIQARGALWISTRGAKMSGHALYYSVTRISKKLLGSPINPHLLRDCAASAISCVAPENILASSRILGHRNLDTTLYHYEQSSMLAAGENLLKAIEQRQITKKVRNY
jgi:integrase/recombinase XerD